MNGTYGSGRRTTGRPATPRLRRNHAAFPRTLVAASERRASILSTENTNSKAGAESRIASLRPELLPTLPSGRPSCGTGGHLHQPCWLQMRQANQNLTPPTTASPVRWPSMRVSSRFQRARVEFTSPPRGRRTPLKRSVETSSQLNVHPPPIPPPRDLRGGNRFLQPRVRRYLSSKRRPFLTPASQGLVARDDESHLKATFNVLVASLQFEREYRPVLPPRTCNGMRTQSASVAACGLESSGMTPPVLRNLNR
ncbi:hypothetical protein J2W42_005259 [Rhizobium tibeticum]|nr:hypothetical protein [Rhizobium tibeticum]